MVALRSNKVAILHWAILACVLGVMTLVPSVQAWSYRHQAKWQGMCATGLHQSPVDINFADNTVVYDNALKPIGFRGFKADAPKGALTVSNNGKTLVAAVHPSANIRVMGGFFPEAYNIAQINLHWGATAEEGSDHSINGKKFPLEAHFVGYRGSSLKQAVASSQPDALVELAVMFKIGDANPAIQALIDAVVPVKAGVRVPLNKNIRLGDLIPFAASSEYVTYLGSLSSPPCTENVNWVVFRNVLTVSEDQLKVLRTLQSTRGKELKQTFRTTQPLNGRLLRASFPFVVRKSTPSVVSTPIGHVVTNVQSVQTPAVGAPDPTAVPAAVPVVDVPTPKVPVKNVVVAANNQQAIGSTSTTYNVSPLDEKNPNGPQKIESVVQSTAAHPVAVAAAAYAQHLQDQPVFASPPTTIPPHIMAAAGQPSPLKQLLAGSVADRSGYVTLSDSSYVESETELKAKVNEAASELLNVSDFARKARAEQLAAAGVAEINGVQYMQAEEVASPEEVKARAGMPSLLETDATAAPIDLAHLDKTPTQAQAPKPKLAVILDDPINSDVVTPLKGAAKAAALKVKKAIEADKARIHDWAFETYRVEHPPIIPPNTNEARYVGEAWSNNTHPIVPTGDKAGLYMRPQPMYNGKPLTKVTSFYTSNEKYHPDVEYLPEDAKLPDLGFKFPSLKTALKPAPYEVDGTVTSIPNTNEVYVPPTGPLTRSAGTTMLPQRFYPKKNYKTINADREARQQGLEYAKSTFELRRKDAQYSELPDALVAHVKANPQPNTATLQSNTPSFAEIDSEAHAENFPATIIVAAPQRPTLTAADVKDGIVQDQAAALARHHARLLAAEAQRSEFLRLLAQQNADRATPASLLREYNAIQAHLDRTLPAAVHDLAAYQNARYAAAAATANINGVPVYAPAASYSAMVSQSQLFQKAREEAMRSHLAALSTHLKSLARRDARIAQLRKNQADALGVAALKQAQAVDAATAPLVALPSLTGRVNSLISAVENISAIRQSEEQPAQSLESVRAQRQEAEAQLQNLLAVRQSLRNAQADLQNEHGQVDAALAESLNNVEALHAHQTAAIDAQASTVNALAASRNVHAAAQAKAALKTIKSQASSALNAEAAALARLAELKRQTAAQEAELKANNERLSAMRAKEAALKAKLSKATETLAKTEEKNKAQESTLAEEKARIATQKAQIKERMRHILNASRKLRATALKLQNEQSQRVRQAIAKTLASGSTSSASQSKKVSSAQVTKDWKTQVEATRNKIASTLKALKQEGATDAEIEGLARAADV